MANTVSVSTHLEVSSTYENSNGLALPASMGTPADEFQQVRGALDLGGFERSLLSDSGVGARCTAVAGGDSQGNSRRHVQAESPQACKRRFQRTRHVL
eukprot:scaffold478_cov409-Prasinococcus_capsulatus_cf.AAC.3